MEKSYLIIMIAMLTALIVMSCEPSEDSEGDDQDDNQTPLDCSEEAYLASIDYCNLFDQEPNPEAGMGLTIEECADYCQGESFYEANCEGGLCFCCE